MEAVADQDEKLAKAAAFLARPSKLEEGLRKWRQGMERECRPG